MFFQQYKRLVIYEEEVGELFEGQLLLLTLCSWECDRAVELCGHC